MASPNTNVVSDSDGNELFASAEPTVATLGPETKQRTAYRTPRCPGRC